MNLVNELRELLGNSTPGQWRTTMNGDAIYVGDKQDGGECIVQSPAHKFMSKPEQLVNVLEFIAEVHNKLPRLLELLQADENLISKSHLSCHSLRLTSHEYENELNVRKRIKDDIRNIKD